MTVDRDEAPSDDNLRADLEQAYDAAFGPEPEFPTPDDLADKVNDRLDRGSGGAAAEPESDDQGAETETEPAEAEPSIKAAIEDAASRIFDKEPAWLTEAFAPYATALQENKLTPQTALQELLSAHDHIVRDPARGIVDLALRYGADEQQFGGIVRGLMAAGGLLGEGARLDYFLEVQRERQRPTIAKTLQDAGITPELRQRMYAAALEAFRAGKTTTLQELIAQVRPPAPKPAAKGKELSLREQLLADADRLGFRD